MLVGWIREGWEDCIKHLKRGWNRKEGRGNKYFKKGEQAASRVGSLTKGAGWNPLTNYESNFSYKFVGNMIVEVEA